MSTERLHGFSKILHPRNKTRKRNQMALFLFLCTFDNLPCSGGPVSTHRMRMSFRSQDLKRQYKVIKRSRDNTTTT